jgi:hypothetical protein
MGGLEAGLHSREALQLVSTSAFRLLVLADRLKEFRAGVLITGPTGR